MIDKAALEEARRWAGGLPREQFDHVMTLIQWRGLKIAKLVQDAAIDATFTDQTRMRHGRKCACTNCVLNEAELDVRAIDIEKIVSGEFRGVSGNAG